MKIEIVESAIFSADIDKLKALANEMNKIAIKFNCKADCILLNEE